MNMIDVLWKALDKNVLVPKRAHVDDAAYDCKILGFKSIANKQKKELKAENVDEYVLKPLERVGCQLGFATAIPMGYFAFVLPRSGNALWNGITILNTPGTIDAGYRNEWMAIVANISNENVVLKRNENICQIVLVPCVDVNFVATNDLPESKRDQGGFGSTGR